MSRVERDFANSLHHPHVHVSSSTTQPLFKTLERAPKIAIVGAGISGLRCADILLRSGFKVSVYVARSKFGVPVSQECSWTRLMDLGPNWIYGLERNNPIAKLATRTRTAVWRPGKDVGIYHSNGNRLDAKEARLISDWTNATMESAFKYSDKDSPAIDPSTSLYSYFKDSFSDNSSNPNEWQTALLKGILPEAHTLGSLTGVPIEKQSLKFLFLEEGLGRDYGFVTGTHRLIIDEIASTATRPNVMKMKTEITHFTRLQDCVQLTTSAGLQHTNDEVVITCPLGWLKRNHSQYFTPSPPARLSSAIENIGYGRLEKPCVTFPSAWWQYNTDGAVVESYPWVTHFHPPVYHPSPSSKPDQPSSTSWNQRILSLSHLPVDKDATLLFNLYGDCSTEVVTSIANLQPDSVQYNEALIAFARPFYFRLPNYNPEHSACVPISVMATKWQLDPLAGNGSYCNFQVGLERGDEDIEVMRDSAGLWRGGLTVPLEQTDRQEQETGSEDSQNMRPGGIFLAGDHVASSGALGTTTGAYWSGEGVARRLCAKWGAKVVTE